MFLTRFSTPWRIAAGGLAAALVLSLLVSITPGGGALASDFLSQFRSQQLTPIEVTPQTQADIVRTMNALGKLGTVTTPGGTSGRPQSAVRDATAQARTVTLAEASQGVGFTLKTPDPKKLPDGLDKTPRVELMPASQVRFTVEKAKADAYFKSTGHPDVTVPDKFNGATLVVSLPAAALIQYGSAGARDALIVGEAGELVVDVEGKVGLEEMRDFLLGLPDMPPAVAKQLRLVKDWSKTIPIPVPMDQVNWQSATFQGNTGLLLNDNSGVGSAAIWYEAPQAGTNAGQGHMYGIAGSLHAKDLKVLAETLDVR